MPTIVRCVVLTLCLSSIAVAGDAFLGISVREPTATLRHHLELKANEGLVVATVRPGGPAGDAGLRPHNVLLEIAGTAVGTEAQLVAVLNTLAPGDKTSCWVIQEGKHDVIEITVGALPARSEQQPFSVRFGDNQQDFNIILKAVADGKGQGGAHTMKTVQTDDGVHKVRATQTNGALTVVVRDHEGNTLFDGPVKTAEDADALPPKVRGDLAAKGMLPVAEAPDKPAAD